MIWAVVPVPLVHRTGRKNNWRRLADHGKRPGRVLDPGKLDHHVVALAADVWFGDAEGVYSPADDGDGLVEDAGVHLALGLEHDRRAALEIEAEERRVSRRQGGAQGDHGDRDDANE